MTAICLNSQGEYVFKKIRSKLELLELRLNVNLEIVAIDQQGKK
jgi:hypothetical protein